MNRFGFLVFLIFSTVTAVPVTRNDYKPITAEQAKRLASWDRASEKQNFWQLSGQAEGDMVLTGSQRNGLINTWYRWSNNVVPYELDPIFNDAQANQIHAAVRAFAASSCVTVRPRISSDVDYVYVTGDNSGCWSYVGRLGGRQDLNLQVNGCVWDDIIIHEFLHAIGFYHEQSSTNRDDYLSVWWQNIISGMEHNFDKYGADLITSFGQPYDLLSIMHYDAWAFTSNGEPTIMPHDSNYLYVIGSAQSMSQVDVNKLNLMYNCW